MRRVTPSENSEFEIVIHGSLTSRIYRPFGVNDIHTDRINEYVAGMDLTRDNFPNRENVARVKFVPLSLSFSVGYNIALWCGEKKTERMDEMEKYGEEDIGTIALMSRIPVE